MESMGSADPTEVLGRRCVAFAVDVVILFAVFVTAFALLASYEDVEDPRIAQQICAHYDNLDNRDLCIDSGSSVFVLEFDDLIDVGLLVLAASLLNLLVIAAATGGSIGKLTAGIRVVDQDTFDKAGVHKHLLRWLLWIADAFPYVTLVPLTGLISALVSSGHRRVADFAAKTLVVDKKYVGVPTPVPGVNDAALPTTPVPGLWTPPVQAPPTEAPLTAGRVADPASEAPTTAPAAERTHPAPDAPDEGGLEPRPDQSATAAAAPQAGQQASQPGVDAPTWDTARNTYIQWDHDLEAWMEWDSAAARWVPISQ